VGNLSYFCEEQHLYDLFSNIIATCEMHTTEDPPQLMSHVSAVRIIYSDGQPQRSLMFGFVTTHNINDATYAAQKLQGSMFMGRKIK
jgi:RNA recognition motif-containing protein